MQPSQITTQLVINNYQALASSNLDIKRRANNFLINLLHRDQALNISQSLIINQQDPNYQVLGAQIMYQKVAQQLQDMSIDLKTELRNFIFIMLQNQSVTVVPLIDKLVSALALIVCTLLFQEWKNFMSDLFQFMQKSPNCLKNGLFLLQRIPEELRITNRIQVGLKQQIIQQFFKYQKQMAQIFLKVLNLNSQGLDPNIYRQLIKRNLNAMQSWSKSRFSFLNYPQIIKLILIHSLQDIDKFQNAIVVIVQTIKSASINKQQTTQFNIDHQKQLELYNQDEINSIKIILQYIEQNKNNFMNINNTNMEPEHRQAFLDIIKQSVLNFGFLMYQNIGFQLLDMIMYFTNSSDLKTSYQTFQFWIDISEKIANNKKIPANVKERFTKNIVQLFQILNAKNIVQIDYMLDDPELKEDLTADDPVTMSYSQYRKQSSLLYQYIYNYFLKVTNNPHAFFQACFNLILKDLSEQKTNYNNQSYYQFHKNTELALFCIKSSQESMVSDIDSENIKKILRFILEKLDNGQAQIKARVSAQVLLITSQCTRQIKSDQPLLYECLKFSMKTISDESLCFYSSQAFKCIIEALDTVSDPNLVFSLIDYYISKNFSKQMLIGEMLEGVFGAIQKFQNRALVPKMMQKLITNIYSKFQKAMKFTKQKNMFSQFNDSPPFYVPLLEIKTILSSYLSTTKTQFQKYFENDFQALCNSSLELLGNIMPYCLINAGQKLLMYNQLGFSCSIYRSSLKICGIKQINCLAMTKVLEQSLSEAVLSDNTIIDMSGMLGLLSDTLTNFTVSSQQKIDELQQNNLNLFSEWLSKKIVYFNKFFFTHLQRIQLADPDVIKWYFTVQQSLILYNQQLFLSIGNVGHILDIAIYSIRHINQQKMQRKVVNVLYLYCHLNSPQLQVRKDKMLSECFRSIPIVNSLSYHNLVKIFLFLFPQMSEQDCAKYIFNLLRMNPYTDLSQNIATLIAQSFFFCLKVRNQRYLIMICKDMQDIVISGEKSQNLMHLQLRLKNWQRQLKKKNTQN